jgi:hypothetical protein
VLRVSLALRLAGPSSVVLSPGLGGWLAVAVPGLWPAFVRLSLSPLSMQWALRDSNSVGALSTGVVGVLDLPLLTPGRVPSSVLRQGWSVFPYPLQGWSGFHLPSLLSQLHKYGWS